MIEREKEPVLREAVMFLFYQEGHLLLEERKDPDKSYFGYTIIPGGKVQATETPEEALIREIEEEHGVDAKHFIFLDSFEDVTPKGNHYLVHAYLVLDFGGEVVNKEPKKAALSWYGVDEALNVVKFANSRYVLRLAKEFLVTEGETGRD